MAYEPTEWQDGDVITAERMNKLEQGVQNEQIGPPGPQGPAGKDGAPGATGEQGPAGQGVPTGGTAGQVLAKKSASNYDTQWIDPPEGSGSDLSAYALKDNPVFTGSISMGRKSGTFSGEYSVATGKNCVSSGYYTHAEGSGTIASVSYAHAEGNYTTASGSSSHSEGNVTKASGMSSHAENNYTTASGRASHAEGNSATASGDYSHAGGNNTTAKASCQTAIGSYNIASANETDKFIIGKGTEDSANANCFRVTHTGTYASGNYNASGADYAEMFEWADGNPDNADRAGHFVTLDGAKIRIATPDDDYIIGIVSGNPSVVGDVYDDQWRGMYQYDIFGRPLWEDVEVPDETIEEPDPENPEQTITRVIIPAHTEHQQKLNPDYDNSQEYMPRSKRPEWDAVGLLGKLVAVDDGTCEPNGWTKVGAGGIATASESRTPYRVMERLDDTHIMLLILR